MILKCDCSTGGRFNNKNGAEFQNEEYGYGMRVHTPMKQAASKGMARCTICENERLRSGQTST
ncbi:hypothetical protein LCGC14_1276670 [marine sediment metagenome]|uniref:Uncharacterized protein n=1 Tax=marine sediment metagenome TaxID=412755 RepID=A0A0F9ND31_9ZZZZ